MADQSDARFCICEDKDQCPLSRLETLDRMDKLSDDEQHLYEMSLIKRDEEIMVRMPDDLPDRFEYFLIMVFDEDGNRLPEFEGRPISPPMEKEAQLLRPLCQICPSKAVGFPLFKVERCSGILRLMKARGPATFELLIDTTLKFRETTPIYRGYLSNRSIPSYQEYQTVHVKYRNIISEEQHDDTEISEAKSSTAVDEIKLALKAKGQHIVEYLAYAYDRSEDKIWIAMELCQRKTLQEKIGNMNQDQRKIASKHFLRGLAQLHSQRILHSDVKMDNIFFSHDGYHLKIGDYDRVRQITSEGSYDSQPTANSLPEIGYKECMKRVSYTLLCCLKPNGNPISVIDFEQLYENTHTLEGKTEIQEKMLDFLRSSDPILLESTNDLWLSSDLINRMFHGEMTFEEALNHPFFWDDYKKLSFILQMKNLFFLCSQQPQDMQSQSQDVRTKPYIDPIEPSEHIRKSWDSFKKFHSEKWSNWFTVLKINVIDNNGTRQYGAILEWAMKKKSQQPTHGSRHFKYWGGNSYDHLRFIKSIHERHRDEKICGKAFKSGADVWKFFAGVYPELLFFLYRAVKSNIPKINYSDIPAEARCFFVAEILPSETLD